MATSIDSNEISTSLVDQFNQNVYQGGSPVDIGFNPIDLVREVLSSGFQFLSTPFVWLFDIIVYFILFPIIVIAFIILFLALQYFIIRFYYWIIFDVILSIQFIRDILIDLGFNLTERKPYEKPKAKSNDTQNDAVDTTTA